MEYRHCSIAGVLKQRYPRRIGTVCRRAVGTERPSEKLFIEKYKKAV